jgi:hypothetical protein
MGAVVTKGTTFTEGQQNVTVAQFNPLLTSATIAGIDRENMGTPAGVATYDDAFPNNPQEAESFQSDSGNGLLSRISSAWVPGISSIDRCTFSADVTAGQLLMPTGDAVAGIPVLGPCTSSLRTSAVGVAAMDGSSGGSGFYVVRGPAFVQAASAVAAGAPVRQSATAGKVESAGAAGTGYGRECVGVALTADSGGFLWVNLRAR